MLPSPDTSPRPVLANRTNVLSNNASKNSTGIFQLPTPKPEHGKLKRPFAGSHGGPKKRSKVTSENSWDDEGSDGSDSDTETEDIVAVRARARKATTFHMLKARAMGLHSNLSLSTRPILQSFVSSHKADNYKCYSVDPDCDLTVPYTCSYSHAAKRGGTPNLAVATEQGTVYIYDTSKRRDWDYEPQRVTLQPHQNGIFDIKWNPSDTLLATCSGDHSTRITCPTSNRTLHVLQGHSMTIKCVAWDPKHSEVLSTGGRDGSICVWDLRVQTKKNHDGAAVSKPVINIMTAHGGPAAKEKGKKKASAQSCSRTITNLLYPDVDPYGFVSSGSFDGILRHWDVRLPTKSKDKSQVPNTFDSPSDPTTFCGARRPRGIISLTPGTGPTSGLIFALSIDARVHTYTLPSLAPLSGKGLLTSPDTRTPYSYSHPNLRTTDFYIRAATSPCGKWLASGSASTDGKVFLFDVSNAGSVSSRGISPAGVELRGQTGAVGALDWADGMLATCADDGTVKVWRPDIEVYRHCVEEPDEAKWDWSWAVDD